MLKARFKIIRTICLAGILGLGLFILSACIGDDGESISDDGTGTILIYNYDNHDYAVELRLVADDSLLGVVDVDDFDILDNDHIDSFVDVPEGFYYLVILQDGAEIDRSSNFSIDEDDTDCFQIDGDGDLEDC